MATLTRELIQQAADQAVKMLSQSQAATVEVTIRDFRSVGQNWGDDLLKISIARGQGEPVAVASTAGEAPDMLMQFQQSDPSDPATALLKIGAAGMSRQIVIADTMALRAMDELGRLGLAERNVYLRDLWNRYEHGWSQPIEASREPFVQNGP